METPAAHTHTESDITDLDHYDSSDFATDHAALTGTCPQDPKSHTHTHASTTGQTTDDHHAKSHIHDGADGSGTVAHSDLTGTGADDHHAQSHTVASHSDTTATGGELNELTGGGTTSLHTHSGLDTDEKVGVSSDDTTPGYLSSKIVSTEGIQQAELSGGGDEDLQLKLDVNGLGAGTPNLCNDYIAFWDNSTSTHKKVLVKDIPAGNDDDQWKHQTIDKDLSTPPGSPSDGDQYIVWPSGIGAWSGKNNNLARWDAEGNAWSFDTPQEGEFTWVLDEDKLYYYTGSAWTEYKPFGTTANTVSEGNHTHALDDLSDIAASSPVSGHHLEWNGTSWVNAASGGGDSEITTYVTTVTGWTLSGGIYYADITHSLGTKDILVEAYTTADDKTVGLEDIDRTNNDTIRIWSATNTQDVRVVVLSTNTGTSPDSHTVQSHTDTTATGTQLNELVGSGETTLHSHASQQLSLPSTDQSVTGTTVIGTVDTNATGFGAALYMASDGNFDEADADSATTMPCRALATEAGTGSRVLLLQGFIRDDSWNWTVGGDIYISTTTGGLTQTAPSGSGDQVQKIGFAWTADIIYFSPGDYTIVEVA